MKKFLLAIFTMFVMMLGSVVKAHAIDCNANEINTGTSCETSKFEVTTTNLVADRIFAFHMTAQGTFYVDWGDGAVQTITRSNTTQGTYSHTYTTGGVKTIRFGGVATGYSATGSNSGAAILFNTTYSTASKTYIASISGSLGALFPSLGSGNNQKPHFTGTFGGCTSLTEIPATLFSGIGAAREMMFRYMFSGCTGLTAIPSGLFDGVVGSARGMFSYTFTGCTRLTSAPANLFGTRVAAQEMFDGTFEGCTELAAIPVGLFTNISGAASGAFHNTFTDCTSLVVIPDGLFANISGAAESLFSGTFSGCTGLTTIPANLFRGVTGAADWMFMGTFLNCTGLTSIPDGLFNGVTGTGSYEFNQTFSGCTNLSGYIPASTFAGLINAGGPTENNMWTNAFANTQLVTACPSGTTDVTPENYRGTGNTTWNGKVACQPDSPSVSVPGSEITSPVINSNIDVASTSYVMGAHRDAVNTAIQYVNAENTRAIAAEGILSNLTTTNKSSLVAAINEVKSSMSGASDSYKSLSNLSAAGNAVIDNRVTTNGSNGTFNAGQNTDLSSNTLGAAINELASDYKNADTTINNKIGNTPLTTTSQTLTGAIEEVKDIAENASDIDAENSEFTADANSNISASTIGGAINELASDYQNADTTINNTIGNTPLTTTSQTLTGAIEEVNTTAADATSDANDVTSAMNSADVTLYTTWGDETNGIANINSMTGE